MVGKPRSLYPDELSSKPQAMSSQQRLLALTTMILFEDAAVVATVQFETTKGYTPNRCLY